MLLQNEDGTFTGMVKQTGAADEEHLREIAEAAYHNKDTPTDDALRQSDANSTGGYPSQEGANHKNANGHVYMDGEAGTGVTEKTRLTEDGCDAKVLPTEQGTQGNDARVWLCSL